MQKFKFLEIQSKVEENLYGFSLKQKPLTPWKIHIVGVLQDTV